MPTLEENLDYWTTYPFPQDGDEWSEMADFSGVPYDRWKSSLIADLMEPFIDQRKAALEIGCGHGRWTAELHPRCYHLWAVDLVPENVDFCRGKLPDATIGWIATGGNLSQIPKQSIHFVWSFDTFVHIDPPEVAVYLAEFKRVLTHDGIAVIHHADQRNGKGWRSALTADLMRKLATDVGLSVIKQVDSWSGGNVRLAGDTISIIRANPDSFPHHDKSLCRMPDGNYASCMTAIRPGRVVEAINSYLAHRRTPEFSPIKGISVGIITNGARPDCTRAAIRSIQASAPLIFERKTMGPGIIDSKTPIGDGTKAPVPVEILLCGNTEPFRGIEGVKLVDAKDDADKGLLGGMRVKVCRAAAHNTLMPIDDDVFFEPGFFKRLCEFSDQFGWDVMGVNILNATGATLRGAGASHDPYDHNYVQTGCFMALRRAVFDTVAWDESLPFYARKQGYEANEDIEYSRRLRRAGYGIAFDWRNRLWHWNAKHEPCAELAELIR